MCSIVGSFDTNKLKDLIILNSYRGSFSHSIAYFDINENKFSHLHKSFGKPDLDSINIPEAHYAICHVQAPTSLGEADANIHPAIKHNSLLWHNGILKPKTIAYLQEKYKIKEDWDTALLLREIYSSSPIEFDKIDGSFSCVYYEAALHKLYLFRNEISPMFVDDDFNISSTKFEGSEQTESGAWIEFNPKLRTQRIITRFLTVENPYYFLGE